MKMTDYEQEGQNYIGRFAMTEDRDCDIKVYDWRSPIASVFCRFGLSAAEHLAPPV